MTNIRRATGADSEAIAALLARAFDDDPFINFVTKQDNRRRERILTWARAAAGASIALGETDVTDELTGAALWTPPDQSHSVGRLRRWWLLRPRLGPIGALRVAPALDAIDDRTPSFRHAYLRIIAVDPAQQRHAIGASLLAHGLDRWDREHVPISLFSTKAANVPLYARHGFELTKELQLPGGPMVWMMLRRPQQEDTAPQ